MAIYCWGNTAHGELGLEEICDERILVPRKMDWSPPNSVLIQVSCGHWHTLYLTSNGKLFSCGSNDKGQLGHELPTKRPQQIKELDNYFITRISCGARHSIALTSWGQLYAWGHNDYGQLGVPIESEVLRQPKIVRYLGLKIVVQVACGSNHSLALTSCGELYSWGSNTYGQLGTMEPIILNRPRLINVLYGIPIAFIACGANHSFVVSKSGAVFGWGHNNCGQLGLNDYVNRPYPTQLKTLRNLGVRYIACGDEFSVFLTNDGGVFTCGSGRYGQLGHGNNSNEVLPRKVVELMGSTITQIACGTRHTLAFVPTSGRVYGFGLGCSGQLGTCVDNNSNIPLVVAGPWVSPTGQALEQSEKTDHVDSSFRINQIFSGGDHSLVTCTYLEDKVPAVDFRIHDEKTQILHLTEEIAEDVSLVESDGAIHLDLLENIEIIFKSQACINASFLNKHVPCTSRHHGINLKSAATAFSHLRNIEKDNLRTVIWDKITKDLLSSLESSPADIETLRIYLILPLYHEFDISRNFKKLHIPFSNAVINLTELPRRIIANWYSETPSDYFENVVLNFKNAVTYLISCKTSSMSIHEKKIIKFDKNLVSVLHMLVFLYDIYTKGRKDNIHYEIFHWPELTDFIDIQQDYIHWWFGRNSDTLNICNFPFLYNTAAKATLLHTDQALQMQEAMQDSMEIIDFIPYANIPGNQFLVLNVSRKNLVQDTIREITNYDPEHLKRPLKIKFHGEEAEDAGGVRKEFFMLLAKEIIDPKYGMFKEYEDSRMVWFADVTFETDTMYFLIGAIYGLAIYNFTIINLPFPLALYKKLLEEKVDFTDLQELSPTLANSMQQILNYDGDDFEETFGINFEISRQIFEEHTTVPLKTNGENIAVTKENRQEFVDLYVDFIFNKAVSDKFKAFRSGFMKVCSGRVLKIFRPKELMAMVGGSEEYDWISLELHCEYKTGYKYSDDTIKWFWEVFHDLPLKEKKKFLLFLTGSDRIPIQGMKAIKITIQPTNDERRLPVAHTCFNLLDLPRYSTKERLRYKLWQAIQQTHGFSLV